MSRMRAIPRFPLRASRRHPPFGDRPWLGLAPSASPYRSLPARAPSPEVDRPWSAVFRPNQDGERRYPSAPPPRQITRRRRACAGRRPSAGDCDARTTRKRADVPACATEVKSIVFRSDIVFIADHLKCEIDLLSLVQLSVRLLCAFQIK
jgi:hypothetical protein